MGYKVADWRGRGEGEGEREWEGGGGRGGRGEEKKISNASWQAADVFSALA